jgi:hypothetical protein
VAGGVFGSLSWHVRSASRWQGVDGARARLNGEPDDPALVVTATLAETAGFAALRHRIGTGAVNPRSFGGRRSAIHRCPLSWI